MLILATGAVEQNIIFMMTPTMIGLGAGILTVIAGLTSLPRILSPPFKPTNDIALAMSTSRGWLRIHSWSVFIASIVLLVVGLKIWTLTLNEKNNIFHAFNQTSPVTIQALEERVRKPPSIIINTCLV